MTESTIPCSGIPAGTEVASPPIAMAVHPSKVGIGPNIY